MSTNERTRDERAALGLRGQVAELVDELHEAIDAGVDPPALHEIVDQWAADVGVLTFDDLVEEGSPAPCDDCGTDVAPVGDDGRPLDGEWEWFMVQDCVWSRACARSGAARYLCIGCLEQRIGRRLARADFTDAPANIAVSGLETERMRARFRS